jgi:hypothetical protein
LLFERAVGNLEPTEPAVIANVLYFNRSLDDGGDSATA